MYSIIMVILLWSGAQGMTTYLMDRFFLKPKQRQDNQWYSMLGVMMPMMMTAVVMLVIMLVIKKMMIDDDWRWEWNEKKEVK